MPICKISPPWQFLLSASKNSLQSYELSRLSHAANLRKEITALVDQWVEENSSAMLARWLMENREQDPAQAELSPAAGNGGSSAAPDRGGSAQSASDNFLKEFASGRRTDHART